MGGGKSAKAKAKQPQGKSNKGGSKQSNRASEKPVPGQATNRGDDGSNNKPADEAKAEKQQQQHLAVDKGDNQAHGKDFKVPSLRRPSNLPALEVSPQKRSQVVPTPPPKTDSNSSNSSNSSSKPTAASDSGEADWGKHFREHHLSFVEQHTLVLGLVWTGVVAAMSGLWILEAGANHAQKVLLAFTVAVFLVPCVAAMTCCGVGKDGTRRRFVNIEHVVAACVLLSTACFNVAVMLGSDDNLNSSHSCLFYTTLIYAGPHFRLSFSSQLPTMAIQVIVFVVLAMTEKQLDVSVSLNATYMFCIGLVVGTSSYQRENEGKDSFKKSRALEDSHTKLQQRVEAFDELFPMGKDHASVAFLSPAERAVVALKHMHDSPGATPALKRSIAEVIGILYDPHKMQVTGSEEPTDHIAEAWLEQEHVVSPVDKPHASKTPRLLQRGSRGARAPGARPPPLSRSMSMPTGVSRKTIQWALGGSDSEGSDHDDKPKPPKSARGSNDKGKEDQKEKAKARHRRSKSGHVDASEAAAALLAVGQSVSSKVRYPEQQLSKDELDKVQDLLDKVDEWNFPVFELDRVSKGHALYFMSLGIMQRRGFVDKFDLNPTKLRNFLLVIESNYQPNPYHNHIHAADVLQTNHYFLLQALSSEAYEMYTLSSCIAAIVHDYEHNGVNNDFLIKSKHTRAMVYNDRSCQENHHVAAAFVCLREDNNNFLERMPDDKQQFVRRVAIDLVLGTDMSQHNAIVSDFRLMLSSGALALEQDENIRMILKVALKCADISHTSKEEELHDEWTQRITEEFCKQGDLEHELGLPVSPIMDRSNQNLPKSQLGFFKFVVEPLFETWNQFLQMRDPPFLLLINHHRKRYEAMLESMSG